MHKFEINIALRSSMHPHGYHWARVVLADGTTEKQAQEKLDYMAAAFEPCFCFQLSVYETTGHTLYAVDGQHKVAV
jgi:hypothetical protein